ncbi:hypothetical protein ACFX2A_014619 [Malus domestica]
MSWRRKQGGTHPPHNPWTKLQNRRPQHHQDSWQLGVPYWEKQFCLIVGSVPWRKVVETNKYMYLYESIVQWNDSANLETFNNEKYRFWAAINGVPCNISLPDPDIYIDDIDWNSSIDPELILDLEREPEPTDDENQDNGVTLVNPLLLDQSFACTGWGDAEEDFKTKEHPANWGCGWDDAEEDFKNKENPANWGCGWGDAEEDFKTKENPANWDCGWNADNKENPWGPDSAQTQSKAAGGGWDDSWNGRAGGASWGNSDGNGRKKDGGSWYNSKHKTSGYQGDYHHKRGGWRNKGWGNGGKRNTRVHVGCENLA